MIYSSEKMFRMLLPKSKEGRTFEDFCKYFEREAKNYRLEHIVPAFGEMLQNLYNKSDEEYCEWHKSFIRVAYTFIYSNLDIINKVLESDYDEETQIDLVKQVIEVSKFRHGVIQRKVSANFTRHVSNIDTDILGMSKVNEQVDDFLEKLNKYLEECYSEYDKFIQDKNISHFLDEYVSSQKDKIPVALLEELKFKIGGTKKMIENIQVQKRRFEIKEKLYKEERNGRYVFRN